MTLKKTFAAAGIAAALMTGTALPLTAQTAGDAAVAVTEDDLNAFATAAIAVAEVRDAYLARIDTAADEAEQAALAEEGNMAMVAAVEETPGITLERYIEIGAAAEADEELGTRIVMLIQEMTDGS